MKKIVMAAVIAVASLQALAGLQVAQAGEKVITAHAARVAAAGG